MISVELKQQTEDRVWFLIFDPIGYRSYVFMPSGSCKRLTVFKCLLLLAHRTYDHHNSLSSSPNSRQASLQSSPPPPTITAYHCCPFAFFLFLSIRRWSWEKTKLKERKTKRKKKRYKNLHQTKTYNFIPN